MLVLEVEPLDLGADVRALGLELLDTQGEPVRGRAAAQVWSRVLPALAGAEPWTLDFFSHLDRVRDHCDRHNLAYRQAAARSIVVAPPALESLENLLARFETETFGARAGQRLVAGDAALEGELARRGVDAYHRSFPDYLFCAVCDFEKGWLTVLSKVFSTSEALRRLRPALDGLGVEVRVPA